jgi:protein involved in polysaccharide export with SLBB domain
VNNNEVLSCISGAVPARVVALIIATIALSWIFTRAHGAEAEYVLRPADVVHITVFENLELTTDTRVSETGSLSFPLIGDVSVVGLNPSQASAVIARKLSDRGFVAKPITNGSSWKSDYGLVRSTSLDATRSKRSTRGCPMLSPLSAE